VVAAFLAGNIGTFTAALRLAPSSGAARAGDQLLSAVVNDNALSEPWNPQPC
jgi:hypothetical protein